MDKTPLYWSVLKYDLNFAHIPFRPLKMYKLYFSASLASNLPKNKLYSYSFQLFD